MLSKWAKQIMGEETTSWESLHAYKVLLAVYQTQHTTLEQETVINNPSFKKWSQEVRQSELSETERQLAHFKKFDPSSEEIDKTLISTFHQLQQTRSRVQEISEYYATEFRQQDEKQQETAAPKAVQPGRDFDPLSL